MVPPTLEALLAGPPVKKLLFMTDPSVVDSQLKPHWQVRHSTFWTAGYCFTPSDLPCVCSQKAGPPDRSRVCLQLGMCCDSAR